MFRHKIYYYLFMHNIQHNMFMLRHNIYYYLFRHNIQYTMFTFRHNIYYYLFRHNIQYNMFMLRHNIYYYLFRHNIYNLQPVDWPGSTKRYYSYDTGWKSSRRDCSRQDLSKDSIIILSLGFINYKAANCIKDKSQETQGCFQKGVPKTLNLEDDL